MGPAASLGSSFTACRVIGSVAPKRAEKHIESQILPAIMTLGCQPPSQNKEASPTAEPQTIPKIETVRHSLNRRSIIALKPLS